MKCDYHFILCEMFKIQNDFLIMYIPGHFEFLVVCYILLILYYLYVVDFFSPLDDQMITYHRL